MDNWLPIVHLRSGRFNLTDRTGQGGQSINTGAACIWADAGPNAHLDARLNVCPNARPSQCSSFSMLVLLDARPSRCSSLSMLVPIPLSILVLIANFSKLCSCSSSIEGVPVSRLFEFTKLSLALRIQSESKAFRVQSRLRTRCSPAWWCRWCRLKGWGDYGGV